MNLIDQLQRSVLVIKCQLGDRSAWDELYRRYNPPLGYYLRRLTGREQAVGDLQQEIWLAVVRNLVKLKTPEAFTVWFYRIARGKAVDGFTTDHNVLSLQEEHDVADESTEDDPFDGSDAAQVHTALDELRPEQREALLLRFMEDLSYEQIAEVVGCNVGTVRSRIHYGKSALRRQLEKSYE